jgi:hypothetical protein
VIRALKWAGDRSGSALVLVLMAIASVAVVLTGGALLARAALQGAEARESADRYDAAARGAVAVLSQRLAARAAERLGALSQADLDALNGSLATLPAPGQGGSLLTDAASTGVVLAGWRDLEPIPFDEEPLDLWTDQLRRSYVAIPPVGGRIAARTLEFIVYATVAGPNGERRTATRRLSVSRVPPHQDALYVAGDAVLCAAPGTRNRVAGSVRVDGVLDLPNCGGGIDFLGSVEPGRGLRVAGTPGVHAVASASGRIPLASVDAADAEMDPDAVTRRWEGRVRIPSALGARIPATRFATATVAGTGECLGFEGASACGGAAAYHPSLQVRGAPAAPAHTCGAGYRGASCDAARAALTWTAWPFGAGVDGSAAAPDPAAPGQLWKGLYPDPRREDRCTATVAGSSWRTFRCPSNAWGWTLDAGALPVLPGGVLSVARSTGFPAAADPRGAREVLLIRNGRRLAGPLTIHSQLPVVIVGSFNTESSRPALIIAPRITVLPNEAEDQLRTSAVWDSVAPTGSAAARALPLTALSNVSIFAVLRAGACGETRGTEYGGVWRGVPAVLGDWSRAGLRVVGAVEVADETARGPVHCSRWGAPGADPSTVQPRSREVLFDPRLLHPAFQPPGSWMPPNVPSPAAAGAPSRTPARQARAIGGTIALRLVAPTAGGPFVRPPPVDFPAERAVPSPPPPLP